MRTTPRLWKKWPRRAPSGADPETAYWMCAAHRLAQFVVDELVEQRELDLEAERHLLAFFEQTRVLDEGKKVPFGLESISTSIYNKLRELDLEAERHLLAFIEHSRLLEEGKKVGLKIKFALFDKLVYNKLREAMGGNIQYAVSGCRS